MTNVVPFRSALDPASAAPPPPVQSEASITFQAMCLNC